VVVILLFTAVVLLALTLVVGFRCSIAAVVLLAFALVVGITSLDVNAPASKCCNKV
jgi:hypothetical protein